jgi:hypothetical protein
VCGPTIAASCLTVPRARYAMHPKGVTARAREYETGWRATGPALVYRTTVLLDRVTSDNARRATPTSRELM